MIGFDVPISGVLWAGGFNTWIQYLTRGQIYPFAWTDCKLGKGIHSFCQHFSSSLLVIMAIEKCFALYFPLQTKRLCTVGSAKKLSLISALILLIFHVQSFFIYDAETPSSGAKRCIYTNVPKRYQFIHSQIDAFLYSFIPLTVMFTANCLIISKFMMAKWNNRNNGSESVNQPSSKSAVKGSVMLLTVSFAFIILTAPISIAFSTMDDPPVMVYGVVIILLYLNHSINGVLYSISGSRFRHELKNLFLCGEGTATKNKTTTDHSSTTLQSVSPT